MKLSDVDHVWSVDASIGSILEWVTDISQPLIFHICLLILSFITDTCFLKFSFRFWRSWIKFRKTSTIFQTTDVIFQICGIHQPEFIPSGSFVFISHVLAGLAKTSHNNRILAPLTTCYRLGQQRNDVHTCDSSMTSYRPHNHASRPLRH